MPWRGGRGLPNRRAPRMMASPGFARGREPRALPDNPPEGAGAPAVSLADCGPARPARAGRRERWLRPRADRREIAAIFAGGALGTLARAALAEAFPRVATAWPWPTFAVNIAAALLLGYLVTRLQERLPLSAYRRPLLGTGLCGGLSTFSTMQVEIVKMLDAHAWTLAAGYASASVAAGYAAIRLATALARRVRVRA
jgi:CrcB protein